MTSIAASATSTHSHAPTTTAAAQYEQALVRLREAFAESPDPAVPTGPILLAVRVVSGL